MDRTTRYHALTRFKSTERCFVDPAEFSHSQLIKDMDFGFLREVTQSYDHGPVGQWGGREVFTGKGIGACQQSSAERNTYSFIYDCVQGEDEAFSNEVQEHREVLYEFTQTAS